jgi:putative FmdB family regulatory protein
MPIYEYRCEECGEGFELFVRSPSQAANPTCPKCGSQRVERAISLFGVGKASGNSTLGASCDSGST